MLYFTKRDLPSGAILAIYNGRFAFLTEATRHAVQTLIEQAVQPDTHRSVSLPNRLRRCFFEELGHQRLVVNGWTSNVLSGLRVLTRLLWIARSSERAVETYYRMRTQYYLATYRVHEDLVSASRAGEESAVGGDLLRWVDGKVWQTWRNDLPRASWIGLVAGSPFYWLLGWLMSRDFAVVVLEREGGRLRETNIATGGFMNVAGSFGGGPARRWQRWLSRLRLEAFRPNTFSGDWRWMFLKFKTEQKVLEESDLDEREVRQLFARVLDFVARWCRLESCMDSLLLERTITEGLRTGRIPAPPRGWQEDPFRRKIVNFFYLHGN